jgi:hypothetical protein
MREGGTIQLGSEEGGSGTAGGFFGLSVSSGSNRTGFFFLFGFEGAFFDGGGGGNQNGVGSSCARTAVAQQKSARKRRLTGTPPAASD